MINIKKTTINNIKKRGYVLRELVNKNIKTQYRDSTLGALWTVLNPLLTMCVLWIVFSQIFGKGDPIYHIYLLSGNIAFTLMKTSTTQSLQSLVKNAQLLNKVKIPYSVFPTADVLSSLLSFAFSFIALLFVMLLTAIISPANWNMFSPKMLLIIFYIPILTVFSLGMSFILSASFVFFRDVMYLYNVFMTLWNYLTPIFYTMDRLNLTSASPLVQFASQVLKLNPMYYFVELFREIIYGYSSTTGFSMIAEFGIIAGFALLFLGVGLLIFYKTKRNFILYL